MTLGVNITQQELNRVAGDTFGLLNQAMNSLVELKFYLDAKTLTNLEDMGFSDDEALILKSAINDFGELFELYRGTGTLTNPKDFRTFMKQIWGIGVT